MTEVQRLRKHIAVLKAENERLRAFVEQVPHLTQVFEVARSISVSGHGAINRSAQCAALGGRCGAPMGDK